MLTPNTAAGFVNLLFYKSNLGFRFKEKIGGFETGFFNAPYGLNLTEDVKPTVYGLAAELTPLKIVAIN